ncbi:MAG: hypothetical protein IPM39_10785 [Chloroflexi bacterium]|nr:hypothetical protein [Chloroflexota bacterium]
MRTLEKAGLVYSELTRLC